MKKNKMITLIFVYILNVYCLISIYTITLLIIRKIQSCLLKKLINFLINITNQYPFSIKYKLLSQMKNKLFKQKINLSNYYLKRSHTSHHAVMMIGSSEQGGSNSSVTSSLSEVSAIPPWSSLSLQ